VPLKLARDRREEARQQLAAGIDPGAKRKAEKVAQGDTFEAIAREWLALQEPKLAPATFAKAVWTLETLIFTGLGKRPIAKISAPDLLTVLRKIEVRGTYETAHRAKQRCGQVFRYAIATGRAVRQAVELLRELQVLSRRSSYLFSALGNARRPMSENTVNAALRRLGYAQDEMTGQGFRSMASTLLNEQGWHPDLIELQLAHAERNKVRAAYNRAQRLVERRRMMQAWADYLDQLQAGKIATELTRVEAA
jgi:integrase